MQYCFVVFYILCVLYNLEVLIAFFQEERRQSRAAAKAASKKAALEQAALVRKKKLELGEVGLFVVFRERENVRN